MATLSRLTQIRGGVVWGEEPTTLVASGNRAFNACLPNAGSKRAPSEEALSGSVHFSRPFSGALG